jgi:hypothetical protein
VYGDLFGLHEQPLSFATGVYPSALSTPTGGVSQVFISTSRNWLSTEVPLVGEQPEARFSLAAASIWVSYADRVAHIWCWRRNATPA